MTVFMFSLAGVPPMVGFYAKFAIIQALVSTGDSTYLTLAIAAVLLSLIGAFYYLRLVKLMYFDEPRDQSPLLPQPDVRLLVSLNELTLVILVLTPTSP